MYVLAFGTVVKRFPYSVTQLRRDNPNVSFPQDLSNEELAVWNVYPVVSKDAPAHNNATENCVMVNPILQKNQWVQQWLVTTATPAEVAKRAERQCADIRADRNRRLADCDWTQVSDSPVDRAVWASYRQELRDVTGQPGFPWKIIWPVAP